MSGFARLLRSLRAWFLVRVGLWRGRWRRGSIGTGLLQMVSATTTKWRYGLYVPAGLADADTAPLVVVLHGCHQRALRFAYATGWTRLADQRRVRLLCPDQRRRANPYRCWNWFHPMAQRGRGELEVMLAMIDEVKKSVSVDDERVMVVGLSAGGAMAALLALNHGERFRAVAMVAALPFLGELNVQDPRDVMKRGLALGPIFPLGMRRRAPPPLAIVHGDIDEVVVRKCSDDLTVQAMELLRRSGAKVDADTPFEAAGLLTTDYRVDEGLVLRRIEVAKQGHWWSGGPGGHPYCESGGAPFTSLCERFFVEAGALPPV